MKWYVLSLQAISADAIIRDETLYAELQKGRLGFQVVDYVKRRDDYVQTFRQTVAERLGALKHTQYRALGGRGKLSFVLYNTRVLNETIKIINDGVMWPLDIYRLVHQKLLVPGYIGSPQLLELIGGSDKDVVD